jgi:ATP-dependent Clp protease ATP-binding subunit ClpC
VRIRRSALPPSLKEATRGLESLRKEKDAAISSQQYEYAAELRDREVKLQEKIEQLEQGLEVAREDNKPVVTEDDISEVVSMWTGIPVARIASEESQRLLQMEDALHSRVIGQDEAIVAIAKSVRRSRAGLKDPKRPIGVFMFLGPTGVGKTYLPRVLAEFMFGSEDSMIKLDMSEFMEKHNVSRLVGAPPGYIGYDDGGQLTDTVRRKSYCLILLDEIEKAHPDVFNMLLQIFDDGHLTDAKGRKVDFRNTIIIMTSNVGSDLIRREGNLGFAVTKDEVKTAEQQYTKMKEKVLEELKRVFRPEFLNRIDSQVVFHPLSREHLRQIVDLELTTLDKQLVLKGVTLSITDAAKDWLGEKGYDHVFGARPLRRVIQNELEDRLSEALLQERFAPGDTVIVDVQNEELVLDKQAEPALA